MRLRSVRLMKMMLRTPRIGYERMFATRAAASASPPAAKPKSESTTPFEEVKGLGFMYPLILIAGGPDVAQKVSYELFGRENGVSRVTNVDGRPMLHVFDHDDLRYIYQNEGKNPLGVFIPSLSQYWVNKAGASKDNLPYAITSKGDSWRHARAILTPGINTDAVSKYEDLVYKAARASADHAKHYEGSALAEWTQQASFDTFCSLALGKNPCTADPACTSPMKEIVSLEADALALSLRIDFAPPLLQPRDAFGRLTAAYDRIVEIIETEVRALFAQEDIPVCWFKDLRDEQGVSLEQLEHLMAHLFSVAIGTTMYSLQWMIIALAYHPTEQAKVYEEFCAKIGPTGRYSRTGPKMPVLEAFMREANRFYPPLGTVGLRTLEHDLDLPSSGAHVPAGTLLNMTAFEESRDTRLNADADEFRPDRFLRENMRAPKGCPMAAKINSLMSKDPFGKGSRACVGRRAAELEIRMIVTELLRDYELVLDPPNQDPPKSSTTSFLREPTPFPEIKLVPRQRG